MPLQSSSFLWIWMHGNEQVFTSHLGQVYLDALKLHTSHLPSRSSSALQNNQVNQYCNIICTFTWFTVWVRFGLLTFGSHCSLCSRLSLPPPSHNLMHPYLQQLAQSSLCTLISLFFKHSIFVLFGRKNHVSAGVLLSIFLSTVDTCVRSEKQNKRLTSMCSLCICVCAVTLTVAHCCSIVSRVRTFDISFHVCWCRIHTVLLLNNKNTLSTLRCECVPSPTGVNKTTKWSNICKLNKINCRSHNYIVCDASPENDKWMNDKYNGWIHIILNIRVHCVSI